MNHQVIFGHLHKLGFLMPPTTVELHRQVVNGTRKTTMLSVKLWFKLDRQSTKLTKPPPKTRVKDVKVSHNLTYTQAKDSEVVSPPLWGSMTVTVWGAPGSPEALPLTFPRNQRGLNQKDITQPKQKSIGFGVGFRVFHSWCFLWNLKWRFRSAASTIFDINSLRGRSIVPSLQTGIEYFHVFPTHNDSHLYCPSLSRFSSKTHFSTAFESRWRISYEFAQTILEILHWNDHPFGKACPPVSDLRQHRHPSNRSPHTVSPASNCRPAAMDRSISCVFLRKSHKCSSWTRLWHAMGWAMSDGKKRTSSPCKSPWRVNCTCSSPRLAMKIPSAKHS